LELAMNYLGGAVTNQSMRTLNAANIRSRERQTHCSRTSLRHKVAID